MKVGYLIAGFFLLYGSANAQILQRQAPQFTDEFGQQYRLQPTELSRTNSIQGPSTIQFSLLRLGQIDSVNLYNALSPVLLYQSTNTIVVLDNHLNLIYEINGNNLPDAVQLAAAGWADQHQLWIYDRNSQRIGLLPIHRQSIQWVSRPFTQEPVQLEPKLSRFDYTDANGTHSIDRYGRTLSTNSPTN